MMDENCNLKICSNESEFRQALDTKRRHECDFSSFKPNESFSSDHSLDKITGLTAESVPLSRMEMNTCRQIENDLIFKELNMSRDSNIESRRSPKSSTGSQSSPLSSECQLPTDCSKWTSEQLNHIISQLHSLQTGPSKYSSTGSGGRHDVSSDESIITPSSLSAESMVLPSPAPRISNIKKSYVWNGELPPRNYSHPVFSCKIFVGGVPWDITEDALIDAFNEYGNCRVEWPGKEPRYSRSQLRESPRGKATGYVYMIFEQESSVKALLQGCSQEFGSAGEWYFKLLARRNQTTEIRQVVQIIPWVVSDASYVADPGCRLDAKKTVFVGALHGMITANVLYSIMQELYGDVVFVGIDTDKYKYPIGSGRVTFSSHRSYFLAIESGFLEIKTSKFGKKVQIDPFLEDAPCMMCNAVAGPYFCRDRACFRYFCHSCWQMRHTRRCGFDLHRPLMRNAPRVSSPVEDNDSSMRCSSFSSFRTPNPFPRMSYTQRQNYQKHSGNMSNFYGGISNGNGRYY